MSLPDSIEPVARYVVEVGLRNTLKLSAIALVGSTLVGITLGTLLTIRFLPTRALIRLYIEIWRGLPILVTIFVVFFALPAVSAALRFDPITAGAIALILWGSAQVAETTRGPKVKTLVSMDPLMVDGTGMCGGCRVTVAGKPQFACVDGPCFDAHEVDFDVAMRRNKAYVKEEREALEHVGCVSGRG